MAELGIGVIGCGEIALTYHLPSLARMKNAEVVAVASRTAESAKRAADEFAVSKWYAGNGDEYAGAKELLADEDVDAVLILTPQFTRVDLVKAAALAGKPMLVQKPLGRNERESRAILDAIEKAEVLMVPSFMHRFLPEVLKAMELLNEGLLGSIRMVRVRNSTPGPAWSSWFYKKELVGGGVAIDLGAHGIDLVRWLVGEVESVYARVKQFNKTRMAGGQRIVPDNEDAVIAIYELANGAMCCHEISWCEYKSYGRFEMEIYGEDGSMLIRSGFGPLAVSSRHLRSPNHWFLPDLPRTFVGIDQHNDFVTAVLEGPTELTPKPEDGLINVRICEALYESAASGRRITISPYQRGG
jgi:predicted dehydrogenase